MRSRLAKLWNANALLVMYVALVAAMLFATLARASTDPVADTRQIMAGTVTTKTSKNAYLSGARDGTTAFQGALAAYKAVRAAEPPLTVKCLDGAIVQAPGACPAPVPPAPTPVPAPTPIPAPTPTPTPAPSAFGADVVSEGDSISYFWAGSYTGIYARTHPAVVFKGIAVAGASLGTPTDAGNNLYARQAADLAIHARVLTVLIGANDLNAVGQNWFPYQTVQAYADALFAYAAPFRAAGTKVVVGTVLPQCQQGDPTLAVNVNNNTLRALLNPIIRAAVGTKIDAVTDYAADPLMGPDAAACNKDLYVDGLHPTDGTRGGTDQNGQGKVEAIYAPVVDALLAAPVVASGSVDNPLVGVALGAGAADIATVDHDVLDDLQSTAGWDGPTGIPASNAPDVVGAFRFTCRHTNLAYDDPTLYPGQPGASHLHDQTGVYGWNAFSNYGNLRTGGGGSGCNDVAGFDRAPAKASHSANRTPYWQPALLDGKGNVILADFTGFYYKRRPASDPVVSDPTNAKYMGKAVPLPNGIKFIFGGGDPNLANGIGAFFRCTNGTGGVAYLESGTFAQAVACARAHSDGSLEVQITAPACWDGVHLDSADHRSHLSYASFGSWGYEKCDAAHPFVIPAFTYAATYTILVSDDGDIHFSSDEMDNSKPRGWSFHVDYGPAAWDPIVKQAWEDNCINKLLTCSGGDLGNGRMLKGAAVPYYNVNGVSTALWRNPVRLVAAPPKP